MFTNDRICAYTYVERFLYNTFSKLLDTDKAAVRSAQVYYDNACKLVFNIQPGFEGKKTYEIFPGFPLMNVTT